MLYILNSISFVCLLLAIYGCHIRIKDLEKQLRDCKKEHKRLNGKNKEVH